MGRMGFACGLTLFCVASLQAQSFWETFSNDYPANCLAWTRDNSNPVIPRSGSTWKSRWTANPELFMLADRILLYYRGNGIMPGKGTNYHDRIGVAAQTLDGLSGGRHAVHRVPFLFQGRQYGELQRRIVFY